MHHLPVVPAQCRDLQRHHALPAELLRSSGAHGDRIQPMGLGHAALRPVPFCSPATSCLHGQPERMQAVIERPARTVYRRRIPQGRLGLRLHLGMAELRGGLVPLLLVAGMAGRRQIRHPIGATTGPRQQDVPALGAWWSCGNRHTRCPNLRSTYSQISMPARSPRWYSTPGSRGSAAAGYRSAPVPDLCATNRSTAAAAAHPAHHVGHPALQRGWEPSVPPPTIEKPGLR